MTRKSSKQQHRIRFKRWVMRLLLLSLSIACVQAAVVYTIANRSFPLENSELAILFKGEEGRIAFFYQVVEEEKIQQIHIPGVSEKTLVSWDQRYMTSRPKHLQVSPPTDSTFEDAITAAEAIGSHNIHSVVLVTSDYHLARSWFLLRLLTMGGQVAIHPAPLPSPTRLGQAKMTFNEIVNFWGSLVEMTYYKTTGNFLFDNDTARVIVSHLKDILLFNLP